MPELAWERIVKGTRGPRCEKPRRAGITMVNDTGRGLLETRDILSISAHLTDLWKLSFGTTAFMGREMVQEKLRLLDNHSVLAFPGGTLLEVALLEHHCRVYMHHASKLGFKAVEISDGTISIPRFRRKNIIDCALSAGLVPITEVGKKDPKRQPKIDQLAEEALEDLEWGAEWVIMEGRENGVGIGIYDEHGHVEEGEINKITEIMGDRVDRLIWEAPLRLQQSFLIEYFGSDVNIGNVECSQVLALEALRNGLRFETLNAVSEHLLKSGRWDPNEVEASYLGDAGEPAGIPGDRRQ